MEKTLYIETVGCQMNMLDSEMIVAELRQQGYRVTTRISDADTIFFNTCSVREHAEEKIYSALGKVRQIKQQHPDKIIGVVGCMAQKDQDGIFHRAPFVDLVVGPGQLRQIPQLLERIRQGAGRQLEVGLGRKDASLEIVKRSHETFDPLRDPTMRNSPAQAYLRIQIGCDKFCTYCIVPMVRGPEQGRPPEQILAEARTLADQGCKEITLLGQTVNSYRYRNGDTTTRLSDLIYQIHEIAGLRRIKFVTNYPKDMTNDLLQAVAELPKCSPYLHVPVQSGSNRILASMKRGYTVEEYRDMVDRIRATVPNSAISSDFIVGFSGETDADFQQTCELVRDMRFKNSFIFKYSVRPGTKGAELLVDDVPMDVKRQRNQELLALQNAICEEDNQAFVGQTHEILVEGPSKRARQQQAAEEQAAMESTNASTPESQELTESDYEMSDGIVQLVGRTHCDRIVVFDGMARQGGQFVQVSVHEANAHTLFGTVVTREVGPELYQLA
ncbi:MAG: tRNA (N6-isopentenyl adenosine(37)-C2)-methylthiotransferase MiaB [Planctomycetota bacterium]|nr:tRNA (N6-isopentenyl adenosine(37)-C2)-methylthiotransferase MiaB [Planctomycetota bacterium]